MKDDRDLLSHVCALSHSLIESRALNAELEERVARLVT